MDPQSGSETRMKGFYAPIKGAAFRRCAQSSHSDSYFCFKAGISHAGRYFLPVW